MLLTVTRVPAAAQTVILTNEAEEELVRATFRSAGEHEYASWRIDAMNIGLGNFTINAMPSYQLEKILAALVEGANVINQVST